MLRTVNGGAAMPGDAAGKDGGRPRILVAYHTHEGQSEKIAEAIGKRVRSLGAECEVRAAGAVDGALDGLDGVIVGGSIHAGRFDGKLVDFVSRHRDELNRGPSAFFSVSLTAAVTDPKGRAGLEPIVDGFFAKTGWKRPAVVASFAGQLAYSKYNFLVRWLMRRIAAKQAGSTDTSKDTEYTDWAAVEGFADRFMECVRG
jgi:menaquinone-dependent protoporphyrinogen oxidase